MVKIRPPTLEDTPPLGILFIRYSIHTVEHTLPLMLEYENHDASGFLLSLSNYQTIP